MRSLLRCVTLCAVLVLALCYDSEESNESFEERIVMNRNRANTFITPRRKQYYYRQRKPISEQRAEICEDYTPCQKLALRYGSQVAYRAYFTNNQARY